MKKVAPLLLALLLAALPARAAENPAAQALIDRLHMALIPGEGAYFSVTYQSADRIDAGSVAPRYPAGERAAGGAIYALVTPTAFSALHRLQTDEIWHFYAGTPIELLLLRPDGTGEKIVLGPDLLNGEHPQYVVPHGTWMGGRPRNDGAYSLFGTTMAPAFAPSDFELGDRAALQKDYPRFAKLIAALTR
jgi:hypothetical protein